MTFSTRRGRPRKIRDEKDKGTIELQIKRKSNLTSEPLDLCLSKGLINEQQHNAGIRLRWLYTLKFGTPTLSSYSPDGTGGRVCKYEDINWVAKRQAEYKHMLYILDKTRSRRVVVNTCILGIFPGFLYKTSCINNTRSYHELELLVSGLDAMKKFSSRQVNTP